MRPFLVSCAVLVAAACSSAAAKPPAIPKDIAEGRDLRQYEDGGVYLTPVKGLEAMKIDQLRRFAWKHWTERRKGYVTVITREGGYGSRNYLFIEPSRGKWHVVWRIIDYSNLPEEWPLRPLRDIVAIERCRTSLIFFDADGRVVITL